MAIELITTPEQLRGLQAEWDHAVTQSKDPSIFNDFTYVWTAWRHFSKDTDRLFVIILRRSGAISAIAPWFISYGKHEWRRVRIVNSIGLMEGDRPGIIAVDDEDKVWGKLLTFLCSRWRDWDILRLNELYEDSPALSHRFPGFNRFKSEIKPVLDSYFISLNGDWENYLKSRNNNVRRSYQRRERRLSEQLDPIEHLCFQTPEEVRQALPRFVALEQSSWKKTAGIGVSRETKTISFYEDLLPELACRGMAEIHLLQARGRDIAAEIIFKNKHRVYSRETTYDPEYAPYSPGTLLMANIIKRHFESDYLELDMMGCLGDSGHKQKTDWATGKQSLVQLTVVNRWAIFLARLQNRLARLLRFSGGRSMEADKCRERAY